VCAWMCNCVCHLYTHTHTHTPVVVGVVWDLDANVVHRHLHLLSMWHDSFICVTRLIHMCDMTHSYVWHDALVRVTWRIHMCDMTHVYLCHDSFICATWPIHLNANDVQMNESRRCIQMNESHRCTWILKTLHIHVNVNDLHICDTTHSYVRHDSLTSDSFIHSQCAGAHS